jgi:hypothetical protein
MDRSKHITRLIYLFLLFLCIARPTFAYLDPGTGSYVFQLVIAGLLGSTFFLKSIIKKIRSKFGKTPLKKDPHENT